MSQAKLTIRPLPHLDFVAGFPGIPAGPNRTAACIRGVIDVRCKGGVKAAWLRIELRKLESAPSGERWGELIGRGPLDVWSAKSGRDDAAASADDSAAGVEGGRWEQLHNGEFDFRIPVPEGLPPSARIEKQSAISYELVASLCVRGKKGLLRNTHTSSIVQSTHPVVIEKHDLHSLWPIYSTPDEHVSEAGGVKARVERDQTCFGPGDTAKVRVYLFSNSVSPVKVKTVAFSLRETITYRGVTRSSRRLSLAAGADARAAGSQKTEMIANKSTRGKKLYKGEQQEYELQCQVPKNHALMSITTAKHIEVSYTLRVYVDISKNPIVIDHLPVTMTTFTRAQSQELVPKIGHVPSLDDPFGGGARRSSSPRPQLGRSLSLSSGANTQIGGWTGGLRRKDTQLTQASTVSGPGMAGRGIPGQIFNWQMRGGSPAMPGTNVYGDPNMHGAVRPAFAGPSDEVGALGPNGLSAATTEEENRALFHHTNQPGAAASMGLDVTALQEQGLLSGSPGEVGSGPQGAYMPPPNSYGTPGAYRQDSAPGGSGYSTPAAMNMSRPTSTIPTAAYTVGAAIPPGAQMGASSSSSSMTPVPSAAPGRTDAFIEAEQEKMHLYERAKMQAERNQRMADERRNQLGAQHRQQQASLGGNAAASSSLATGPSPSRANGVTASAGSTAQRFPSGSNEKQMLYERARREAETYQSGFLQGASFPKEDLADGGDDHDDGAGPGVRGSAQFWTGAAAAGSAGANSARAAGSASSMRPEPLSQQAARMSLSPSQAINGSGPSAGAASSSSMTYNHVPAAAGSSTSGARAFPSAEEEKRRLYERAKADVDAHQANAAAASTHTAPRHADVSPPVRPTSAAGMGGRGAIDFAGGPSSQAYETAPLPVYATSSMQPASESSRPASMMAGTGGWASGASEKEQMRLYYAARDAQSGSEATASGSSSAPTASASGARTVAPAVTATTTAAPAAAVASQARPLSMGAAVPAPSEKEQLRLYYEARDAQARAEAAADAAGASMAAAAPTSSGSPRATGAGPTSSFANVGGVAGASRGPTSSSSGPSEKEQMRLYYAARDAQLRSEQQAGASQGAEPASVVAAASSLSSSPAGRAGSAPGASRFGGAGGSQPTLASSAALPPRVQPPNLSPPPVLPPLRLGEETATATTRAKAAPSSTTTTWAPRVAQSWLGGADDEGPLAASSSVGPAPHHNMAPPPLPPKTPIQH